MWHQAKLKFRQMVYDDSGIAMAYTIVVFLVFFMICVATYAMSENIRQKMEMQNACDAAAYSGAVVQADMLARIAVLNRALSWTYAETNKRQMDETVHNWLGETLSNFNIVRENTLSSAIASNAGCECPGIVDILENGSSCGEGKNPPVYWMVGTSEDEDDGVGVNDVSPDTVWLNGPLDEAHVQSISSIETARRSYTSQQEQINAGIHNVRIINNEISTIVANIDTYILNAANKVTEKYADTGAGFKVLPLSASSCFEQETSESNFLAYSNNIASLIFQKGCDVWWINNNTADGGIRRMYNQTANSLLSRFLSILGTHADILRTPCKHRAKILPAIVTYGRSSENAVAYPFRLKSSFFGKDGTIVVAAQKNVVNPLSVLFGTAGIYTSSLYFGQTMTAVSAARAGIRLKGLHSTGEYSVFYPGDTSGGYYLNGVWNLCEDDWDAVLLPMKRAWCTAPANAGGRFSRYSENEEYSADAVLNAVYNLYGQTAPQGTDNYMWH